MKTAISTTLFLAALTTFSATLSAADGDWPRWRGPNGDGISKEKGLLQSWPEGGPKLVRATKGLGSGYASVAVVGDAIYTLGVQGRDTALIALDRNTGNKKWSTAIGGGGEPNCTPTVDPDGKFVYGLSKKGDFLCADAKTGRAVWRKNFGKDFGGKMMSGWGYSESPLVDGDLLICTPGAGDAHIVALNKATGKLIWKAAVPGNLGRKGNDGAGYSSIVISKAAGVKQYVQFTGKGVFGFDASNGKYLWHYNKIANGTANIPTPIVDGDFVFCTSGYGDGGTALLKIKKSGRGFEADEVYYKGSRDLQNHHGGVIQLGDYIYGGHGHNRGLPFCLQWKTGKVVWRNDDPEIAGQKSAAMAYADGHLYFRYEDGTVTLVEATTDGYKEKGKFTMPRRSGPSWPHPVIAGGMLYLRNQDELQVYDIRRID